MTQEPENFDALLDQALQSYSSAEPRPGFEERILASTASQPAKRSLALQSLLWMSAAAALAAILIIVIGNHTTPKPQLIARGVPTHAHSIPEVAPVLLAKPATGHTRQPLHHILRSAPAPEHGLPQLTSGDLLLVQFASLHPKEALSFSEQQKFASQKIVNSKLQIEPLMSNPIVITPIALNRNEQASF